MWNLAQGFLGAANSYTGDRIWTLTTLSNDEFQNIGYVAPIPLPAAGWLLITAMGGLAVVKRRVRGPTT